MKYPNKPTLGKRNPPIPLILKEWEGITAVLQPGLPGHQVPDLEAVGLLEAAQALAQHATDIALEILQQVVQ